MCFARSKLTPGQQLALGVGAYFLLKQVTAPKPPPANQTPQTAQSDADALAQQGVPLSYPLSYYGSAADILESAWGNDYDGTNEAQVYAVFNAANNQRDVLQLIVSFGVRPYCNIIGMCADISLPYWMAEEMTDSEIGQVNSILASKGINYRF
jgi:hypothetical protein